MDFATASRGKRLNLSPSNHLSSKTPNFPRFPRQLHISRKTFGRVCFSYGEGGEGFSRFRVARDEKQWGEQWVGSRQCCPSKSLRAACQNPSGLSCDSYIRPPHVIFLTTYTPPRYIWRSLMHYSAPTTPAPFILPRFFAFCFFLLAKKQLPFDQSRSIIIIPYIYSE